MMSSWSNIKAIMKRELGGYFSSPVAYVFLIFFLLLTGFFTFTVGNFFERGEASLVSFFTWHPWLYLFLVPAAGMRLWSEERRLGTLELLLTMPITTWQAITGKFFASWLFLILALALTFPVWITVNLLGSPDAWCASFFHPLELCILLKAAQILLVVLPGDVGGMRIQDQRVPLLLGYSALFVTLDRATQDDIIRRTSCDLN